MLNYFWDKILDILATTILILYRKLCRNIVSIIVLNVESRQYNIKIHLAISCSPNIHQPKNFYPIKNSVKYTMSQRKHERTVKNPTHNDKQNPFSPKTKPHTCIHESTRLINHFLIRYVYPLPRSVIPTNHSPGSYVSRW